MSSKSGDIDIIIHLSVENKINFKSFMVIFPILIMH